MHKKTAQILRHFPELVASRTRRHYRISNPKTGDFTITSATPSGNCYEANLRSALFRLRNGFGFLEDARQKRSTASASA